MTLFAKQMGLCADCRYARLVQTNRGSSFLLCNLSSTDTSFPKYPPLPVRICRGYEANDQPTSGRAAL